MKISEQKVELIDSMGSDLSVVNAARVSFHKESEWEAVYPQQEGFGMAQIKREGAMFTWDKGEVRLSEKDAKLIAYLAKHGHWTPFAHAFLSFRIKAPIFVARQLVKHQVGLAWNEVSRRYVDDEPEFWFPEVLRKKPDGSIKQGSGVDYVGESNRLQQLIIQNSTEDCLTAYNQLLRNGVAPELARMVLPLNTMTEWIWSGSLMAFARVCKLRLDPHAQAETQEIARGINDLIPTCFLHSWKALLAGVENHYPTEDATGKGLLK